MVGQAFLSLATAFGLSTSAGLNAYIPLLVVALLARFTPLVTLNEPWDALSSWWVIGTLAVLLVVEILVDKIPAVDTVNDVVQTFIRPAAGAILFAATTNAIGLHPVLAAICGVILAGGVHVVKAGGRPGDSRDCGGRQPDCEHDSGQRLVRDVGAGHRGPVSGGRADRDHAGTVHLVVRAPSPTANKLAKPTS